jgi:hypothetical protein
MVYSNNFNQVRVGIRNTVVTQVVNAVDADATAFIAAAGITDLTQAAAISTLVSDLKTYGIWSKMKALYPFVGGSATSHKFNLKDPRDLDAAYRLVFTGSVSHTSIGFNGAINGYADTKLNDNILSSNNAHFSIYSNTNVDNQYCDGGTLGTGGYEINIFSKYNNLFYPRNQSSNNGISNTTGSTGLFITNRIGSSEVRAFQNTTLRQISSSFVGKANLNIFIGALNTTTGAQFNSLRKYSFSSIGDGLSDTEAANFYTSVQKFQTTLGRQVGTPYVSDSDAQAFLTAASITDTTQATAINTLVTDLKVAGIWTKMKAIYPFVGGTATSHKWNLKDPRDLNAAYRLVFNGGGIHSSTGYKGSANGYAQTFLNAFNVLQNSNLHLSFYSRTADTTNAYSNEIQQDSTWSSSNYITFRTNNKSGGGTVWFSAGNDSAGASISSTENGFYIGSETASNLRKMYRNGSVLATNTTNDTNSLPNANLNLLGSPTAGAYSLNETAFTSIGDGLTDSEASSFNTAVQKFQTTLGRQVNTPSVSDSDAQAFLTATGITSYTQANAVNTLVVDLKAAGIWTKMKAIYPMVGGSATTHKFNLKDSRDVDAAYRLQFNGGWTHGSNGATPNGTTAYANTYLIPNDTFNVTNLAAFGYYSLTSAASVPRDYVMGAYTTGRGSMAMVIKRTNENYYTTAMIDFPSGTSYRQVELSPNPYTGDGLYMASQQGTNFKFLRNTTLIGQNGIVSTNTQQSTHPIFIGALNGNGSAVDYTNKVCAFSFLSDKLSDSEATSFYNAVQKFNTFLGRQVGTPVYNNSLVLNLDAGNANSYPGTGTTWYDLASGKNATLLNGPTYNTNGSLLLDGVNDRIDTSYTPGTFTKQTIVAWINRTNTQYCFILQRNSSPPFGFEIYPTTIYVSYGAFEAYVGYNPTGWHQLVYTYDGTQTGNSNRVKVYVNGILQTLTFGSSVPSSITINDVMQVGWRPWSSLYSGFSISTLQMYNTALSEAEVLQNFNNTRGRFGI